MAKTPGVLWLAATLSLAFILGGIYIFASGITIDFDIYRTPLLSMVLPAVVLFTSHIGIKAGKQTSQDYPEVYMVVRALVATCRIGQLAAILFAFFGLLITFFVLLVA